MKRSTWKIWADTGGTFTDCIAVTPTGELRRAKVLSSSALRGTIAAVLDAKTLRVHCKWNTPDGFVTGFRFRLLGTEHATVTVRDYDAATGTLHLDSGLPPALPQPSTAFEVQSPEEAPVLAARLVTGTPAGKPLPPIAMRLATTRGTNALLERRGVPVALFITRGFGDLLRIGTQQRPDLFALDIRKPEPLYQAVVEVDERLNAEGHVLRPLHPERLRKVAQGLLDSGIRVAAIALMHSYRNPAHEQRLTAFLRDLGFEHISASAELAPLIKLLPRAETAVVDAYLAPIIGDYLQRIRAVLQQGRLHIMTSAGGLVQPGDFRAKDSLLSGPAGGVRGAALSGERSGFRNIIAFDMGGTSTDVARYDGDFEYVFEHRVGDAHLVAPALAIESVAAGGGSVCWFDGARLRVGPQSAGASPGPACYGAGGPLAITDVNLLLGRLDPERFEIPLGTTAARAAFTALHQAVLDKTGEQVAAETHLVGFLDIANERMADAIRRISLRKGYDPADYALVAFGGAGGQHACAVAERLSMTTALIPPDTSLLSALGLGHAPIERFAERQILQPLAGNEARLEHWLQELATQARAALRREGIPDAEIAIRRRIANLRFVGQDSTLSIECAPDVPVAEAFARRYQVIYAHWPEGRPIEIESLRVVASTRQETMAAAQSPPQAHPAAASVRRQAFFAGKWQSVPVYERENLAPGARLPGPALIFERHSTTVVEPGWRARVDAVGAIILEQ